MGKNEENLNEAIELIEYFVKRVEEGSIKSKTTYKKYKDFLDKYKKPKRNKLLDESIKNISEDVKNEMDKQMKHIEKTKAKTTIRNGNLFCLNCGAEFKLTMPMLISEMTKKTDAFNKLHEDCKPTWVEPKADQSKTVEQKAIWWITNGETGMSSEAMWSCFMNRPITNRHHPYDPDDFSRCYKLLEAVPEWKLEMNKLKCISNVWERLVDNWDKLTKMYEQNKNENWKNYKEIGMYEFMQELILNNKNNTK